LIYGIEREGSFHGLVPWIVMYLLGVLPDKSFIMILAQVNGCRFLILFIDFLFINVDFH